MAIYTVDTEPTDIHVTQVTGLGSFKESNTVECTVMRGAQGGCFSANFLNTYVRKKIISFSKSLSKT